jgi:hypothetical protein
MKIKMILPRGRMRRGLVLLAVVGGMGLALGLVLKPTPADAIAPGSLVDEPLSFPDWAKVDQSTVQAVGSYDTDHGGVIHVVVGDNVDGLTCVGAKGPVLGMRTMCYPQGTQRMPWMIMTDGGPEPTSIRYEILIGATPVDAPSVSVQSSDGEVRLVPVQERGIYLRESELAAVRSGVYITELRAVGDDGRTVATTSVLTSPVS